MQWFLRCRFVKGTNTEPITISGLPYRSYNGSQIGFTVGAYSGGLPEGGNLSGYLDSDATIYLRYDLNGYYNYLYNSLIPNSGECWLIISGNYIVN